LVGREGQPNKTYLDSDTVLWASASQVPTGKTSANPARTSHVAAGSREKPAPYRSGNGPELPEGAVRPASERGMTATGQEDDVVAGGDVLGDVGSAGAYRKRRGASPPAAGRGE